MKVIHWSPIENKESILEKGLLVKDTWLCGNLLTPFHSLNRWWLDFIFKDQECLGYIFDLQDSDFPLVYNHWVSHKDQEYDEDYNLLSSIRKPIASLLAASEHPQENGIYSSPAALQQGCRENILWRIGEQLDTQNNQAESTYISNAIEHIQHKPSALDSFIGNPDFMIYTFEDYELLLSNHILPERIIKVVTPDEVYKYYGLLEEMRKFFKS